MSESQAPINGTISALNGTVDLTSPNSGTSLVQLGGTWSGTLVIEGSNDNVTYFTVQSLNRSLFLLTTAITTNGVYDSNTNGFQFLRIRASAWTSGTVTVSVYGSDATSLITTNTFIRGATDSTLVGNDGDRLKVQSVSSKVSTLNSTSVPLLAGATFTGTWEECINFSTITISIFTSHISATNGFKYQTSTDGTNWDDGDLYTIPVTTSGNAKIYSFGVTSRYYRVIYENGGTNQTEFRLQTILHSSAIKNSSHRVNDGITDEDDTELVKSVITGKSSISGAYTNVATDDDGRLLISGQSELLSPLPSIKIVDRRVLAASGVYAFTENITQNTAIKEFTFGGRGPGEGMFGRYDAATETFVPGGDFESSGDVSMWSNTGNGDGALLTLTYSTDQAFTGTGSLKLGPATRSDANHYPEITYTWSTPQSLDSWRYVTARFYNFAPAGGAVTRTISIRLTDNAGNIRIYSVAGLTNAAPFNSNQWIQILGEIRIPTSQIGTTFDINNVVSISLRMQDSGNKTYTAIYWDTVKLAGEIEIFQKIYTNGNTIPLTFDPIIPFEAGEVMYLALRNNDTTSKEYQITVAGVDLT